MKTSAFAILALFAMAAVATEARSLQQWDWSKYMPKNTKAAYAPMHVDASQLPQTQTLLAIIFLKCRPQINACLAAPNGVDAVNSAIANALGGDATAASSADATNLNWGPAKALSQAVAQAIKGSATATSAAKSIATIGYTQAVSSSLANAIKGIALSTSQADATTLFGSGKAISSAQANAIAGAAVALSGSNCVSQYGGCKAISDAVANAIGGPAIATSSAEADCLQNTGKPCSASSSASAFSVGGPAVAISSSTAVSTGK